MVSTTEIFKLDGLLIARLLRREVIDRTVKIVRITSYLIILGCFSWIVYQITIATLSTKARTGELANQVALAQQRVSQTSLEPSKEVDLAPIVKRNLFGALSIPTPAVKPADPAKTATKLPLGLIGTYITDGEAPYAIIEDKKKKNQDVFGIGDIIFEDAKVVSIKADRVEIDREGAREFLTIDDEDVKDDVPAGGIAALDGDKFLVDEAEVDQALQNLPVLLTQARAVPYFRDGKAIGLRMFAVKSGSLYEKLGLKNGDILKGINGNSLADLSQALQLFEKLKTERNIAVTLERNSQDKQFSYEIR